MDLQINQILSQGGQRSEGFNRNNHSQQQWGGGNQNYQGNRQRNNQMPNTFNSNQQGGYSNQSQNRAFDNQQGQSNPRNNYDNQTYPRQNNYQSGGNRNFGGGHQTSYNNQYPPRQNQFIQPQQNYNNPQEGFNKKSQNRGHNQPWVQPGNHQRYNRNFTQPNMNDEEQQFIQGEQQSLKQTPQDEQFGQFAKSNQRYDGSPGFGGGNQGFRNNSNQGFDNSRNDQGYRQQNRSPYNQQQGGYRPPYNQRDNFGQGGNRSYNNFQNQNPQNRQFQGGQRNNYRGGNSYNRGQDRYDNYQPQPQIQKKLPPPQSIAVQWDNSIRIPSSNQSAYFSPSSLIISESTRDIKAAGEHLQDFQMNGRKYEPRAERSSGNQIFAFPQFIQESGGKNQIPQFQQATKVKYSQFVRIGDEHQREILKNLMNKFKI